MLPVWSSPQKPLDGSESFSRIDPYLFISQEKSSASFSGLGAELWIHGDGGGRKSAFSFSASDLEDEREKLTV